MQKNPYPLHAKMLQVSQARLILLVLAFLLPTGNGLMAQYFEKIGSGTLVDVKQRSYSASWADVNNNGFDDLLILDLNASDENMLYINNGDGTFTANPDSGISEHIGPSIAATWGDFNNNGFLDVYICNTGIEGPNNSVNFLFENNGDGTFTRITEGDIVTDPGWALGASWADYNKNGHIDLYVANFDGPNMLYQNNGDGTFTRITTGELVTDEDASYGAYWADINNNGWPDLFVANAFGTSLPPDNSRLYINNGDGTFDQVTTGHIVDNNGITHGASWGDYNNNGYLDLFLSNHDWHDNKVNFLYTNNGDGTFTFVEGINVTSDENTSFGSAWIDVNNNGHLDLVVANNKASNRHNFFYINNGDGTFTTVTDDPVVNEELRSFGITVSDYNQSGHLDLFIATYSPNQENGFYQNLGGEGNHLAMTLEGSLSNRAAIGARINVWTDGLIQTREVASASGQYNSSSFVQHFGMADHAVADSVRIQWPSGLVSMYYDVAVNQRLHIIEGEEDDDNGLTPPWSEDFSGNELPGGWTVEDLSGEGYLWEFSQGFANADSDAAGSGNHMWTSLTTPVVNCSEATNVHLYLNHWYRHLGSGYGKILVSADAEEWVGVATLTATVGDATYPYVEYDISHVADGQPQLWVRFEYNDANSWAWWWRIDEVGMYSPDPTPMPAQLVGPADGATDVLLDTQLQWGPGGGSAPTGYRVYLDETDPPTEMIYQGEETSVEAPGLQYSTTYFWQVVPFNDEGDALEPPVWSFTTMDDPTITQVPHIEDFNQVTVPALPLGWTSHVVAESNAVVETSSFAGPNSPPNHARFMNLGDVDAEITLITPPIALDLSELRLRFHIKENVSGSGGENYLEVGTFDPADNSFHMLESINATTEYTEHAVSLDLRDNDTQHLAFRALMGATFQVIYLDDFILEVIPDEPIFEVTPLSADFGELPMGIISPPQVFTLRNVGAGSITISPDDIQLTGDDPGQFILDNLDETVELGANESATVEVSFAPTMEGSFNAFLEINDGLGGDPHQLPLSGEGYDAVFQLPFAEDFTGDVFPPAEWTRWAGILEDDPTLTPVSAIWLHHVFGNQTPGDNNAAYINIWGTRNHWLVSPQIDLGAARDDVLSAQFEIALTPWTGTNPIDLGPDDYVAFLISTDGGNTWSPDGVLIDLTADDTISPTGDMYTIPLDEYSGIVQFAFYAERPSGFTPDLRFYVNNLDVGVADVPDTYQVSFFVGEDNADQTPIEGASIHIDGDTYHTDQDGMAVFMLVDDQTYTADVTASGYVAQEVTFTVDGADVSVDVLLMDHIIEPFNLSVTTEDMEPGEALFTWNDRGDGSGFRHEDRTGDTQIESPVEAGKPHFPQAGQKAFLGFNVYLNDEMVAQEIMETEYHFTGLPGGEHTAGVQSVYTTGSSDIVTIDFEVEGDEEPDTFQVSFHVDLTRAMQFGLLEGFDPEVHHILITGDMVGWAEPGSDPENQVMEWLTADPMVFGITHHLEAGTYEYKYFSDLLGDGWDGGEWPGDPNRVVEVTGDMSVEDMFGPDDLDVLELDDIHVMLYPNPARSTLNIQSSEQILSIRMVDMPGQVVLSQAVQDTRHQIEVSGYQTGVYFIQLTTRAGVITHRVQVTR